MVEKKSTNKPTPKKVNNAVPSKSEKNDNLMGVLAYVLGVFGFILLFVGKKSKFIKFHAFQATLYNLIAWIIISILSFAVIGFILIPVWFIYGLFIAYKAYQGEVYKIPYLGDWCEKQI